jgi:hypothetical protein
MCRELQIFAFVCICIYAAAAAAAVAVAVVVVLQSLRMCGTRCRASQNTSLVFGIVRFELGQITDPSDILTTFSFSPHKITNRAWKQYSNVFKFLPYPYFTNIHPMYFDTVQRRTDKTASLNDKEIIYVKSGIVSVN